MAQGYYPQILQLDKSGNPRKWIDYEKASYYYCKDLVVWESGVNFTTLYGGINRLLNEQSTLHVNSIIAVNGRISKHKKRATLNNQTLFRRDGKVCAYCGNKFSPKDLTRDHIHPQSRGGENTWQNLVTSCKTCNSHKGDYLLGSKELEEMEIKLGYQPYEPNYAEYLFLNNLNMTDDQYDFLTALIPEHSRVYTYYKRER